MSLADVASLRGVRDAKNALPKKGFAVFYPNYRGSTGRGLAFSKTSQGDPAGKEFDDLVDGVDELVKTGLADPARVGITGGSYGGYATAWGAARRHRWSSIRGLCWASHEKK